MSSSVISKPASKPNRNPDPPRINRRRYFWLFVGYYLVSIYIKSTTGKASGLSTPDFSSDILRSHHLNAKPLEDIPGHSTNAEGSEHAHGIQIAKVDFEGVETPFIIALWIFCASLAKIGFHMTPKLSHIFPESCLLIVVGVVIGLLLFHTNSVHVSPLTPKTFFNYMLPPIILDAGYFMPNRLFFDNLGTILLMAVVGTLWNTFTIGLSLWGVGYWIGFGIELPLLQTLLFSALISAVDPVAVLAVFEEIHVNEVLYIVVFGESLLNDAVTVVLYHMFEDYAKMGADKVTVVEVVKGCASFPVVAFGGTAIGIIWGFLTGFVTRFTNHVRVIEPIFIFVMAYLAYLCAETFHMSGILAVTFCGITMKNYVEANISQKSHTTVKYAMKMLSSSSETIIFMFLGVSTIHDEHEWNSWFIAATIIFCTVYRIIGTLSLSALANKFRLHKLGRVDQFVISYGGLRGAVAFALVLLIEEDAVNCDDRLRKMFITTTITVIYFTVFVQGITIKPLVQWLKVQRATKREPTMNERIHERLMDHTMAVLESLVGQVGHYNLRNKFKQFDNQYIRPCLIRDLKGAEPKILETFSKLAMRDAMDMMNRNPQQNNGFNPNKLSPESIAQLIRMQGSSGNLQNDASTWNLDLQELEYNLSRKDMSDAKIHHLLSEELYKPYRRHRRLSYSRHAVHDQDLATELHQQVNYRQPMNFKRMVSERLQKQNKVRRPGVVNNDGNIVSNGRITFGEEYDNPAFSLADERMQRSNDDKDGDVGIYFIAGGGSRVSPARRMTREEDGSSPTHMELPWKRDDEHDTEVFPMKQSEFPAWSSNKEYLAYNSPTNTFLGGIGGQPKMPSVMGIFKRDSISSTAGSRRGSLQSLQQSRLDSPRHSIGSDGSGGPMGHDMASTSVEMTSPVREGPTRRRDSAFLPTPIPEVAEETEKDFAEGEHSSGREGRKRDGGGPPPTSPSHSMKSPSSLEKIEEGDVSSSQTKL
ncbi:probable Na(+)/H(+) antiporter nhx-9 isoform X2 [Folsomia candida]|uniref:probable Na(+)/H(+) antiporter nhx-9 isoform X2 n=1 Tax=Folsomia candida TaxID=158441 RepID=UPI000B9057E4|nr:probable Na(+)/H(+) antiporter nhx-9 isoform X2 [Folsomia candida]